MGDFNEALGDSIRDLHSIVNKYNLLDLLPYHHGMDGEIETFSRGSKQLDYAFSTQELAESIVRIGFTPYNFLLSRLANADYLSTLMWMRFSAVIQVISHLQRYVVESRATLPNNIENTLKQ